VGVHLGSSGVGMPVSFVQASDLLIEVLHKLRPVIGKNGLKRIRKNISDDVLIWLLYENVVGIRDKIAGMNCLKAI
jgi:hypothetical protein